MTAPLRICLDARTIDGAAGGVQQVVVGLASALSKLDDDAEEYLFWTYRDADEWLQPYIAGPCRLLPGARAPQAATGRRLTKQFAKPFSFAGRFLPIPPPPISDGTIEAARIDIMHFTLQKAFLTDVPSIYQPHDLQHIHLPQLFTPRGWRERDASYRAFCRQARMVVAMSRWGKRDLVANFGLPDDKVQIVPWAAAGSESQSPADDDLVATRAKHDLPAAFLFYPAQTWPHKNHLGLLDALALLRDRDGLKLPLVCSGRRNEWYPHIEKHARKLHLGDQVQFLDFVSPLELQCLYRLCRALIFPSKFEGWGLPLTEAFAAGVPVACSSVALLPALAGDAALLFDPNSADEIAAAMSRLWNDETLGNELARRGQENVARFSWDKTARLFRAHYRRIANRATDADRALLAQPPLV